MWTICEFPRILEMYEDEYIIYDVSNWSSENTKMILDKLLNLAELDGSTVQQKDNNSKSIIIRYTTSPETPKHIHLFTEDTGVKITIPEDQTIEDFIRMYLDK